MRLLLALLFAPSFAFAQAAPDTLLTNFSDPAASARWQTVNDNVMGGRSTGGPSFSDGLLIFEGSTNTRGGGFSSIRSATGGWADAEAVLLRVRGDSRRYEVDVQTGEREGFFPIAYRASFVASDEWTTIRLPVAEFTATSRGEPISGRNFDPSKAKTVGLFIYDGRDGAFRIEVDWIGLER
ncbi:MAG: CIA30 family protein [Bacteroidota bacterium]